MKKRPFGRLEDGTPVEEVVLESADAAVSILSYGCVLRDWRVDGPAGRSLPMVLGFGTIGDYVQHARGHGMICGRVANRTAQGRFRLEGQPVQLTRNEGPHHLHGGDIGLQRRVWTLETDSATGEVELGYVSPDGEEGYPGRVGFSVRYRLEGPRLICEMTGWPDRPTPIALAHHAYFNLGGEGDVRDHLLEVDADRYTPTGPDLIPLGRLDPVEGTRFDFREPVTLAEADPAGEGYDINLCFRADRKPTPPAVRLLCPRTSLRLEMWTEEPGLQIYDSAGVTIPALGHDGQTYGPFAGLCLEAQHFPDSLNNPDWPGILRTPEDPYLQRLVIEIARA